MQHAYLKYCGSTHSILGSIFILILHETLQTIDLVSKGSNSKFFTALFHKMLSLFTQRYRQYYFDSSDTTFFNQITELSETFSKDTELRKMNGTRGSKHFLYINKTFFWIVQLDE